MIFFIRKKPPRWSFLFLPPLYLRKIVDTASVGVEVLRPMCGLPCFTIPIQTIISPKISLSFLDTLLFVSFLKACGNCYGECVVLRNY